MTSNYQGELKEPCGIGYSPSVLVYSDEKPIGCTRTIAASHARPPHLLTIPQSLQHFPRVRAQFRRTPPIRSRRQFRRHFTHPSNRRHAAIAIFQHCKPLTRIPRAKDRFQPGLRFRLLSFLELRRNQVFAPQAPAQFRPKLGLQRAHGQPPSIPPRI